MILGAKRLSNLTVLSVWLGDVTAYSCVKSLGLGGRENWEERL